MLAYVSFVFSQFTRFTDGQTDISLMAKTALRRCSEIKTDMPEKNEKRLESVESVRLV